MTTLTTVLLYINSVLWSIYLGLKIAEYFNKKNKKIK